uniref:Impact N-terminal domain-containing protein n=1 Tax=Aureoumbra lagunensis TaxID=44058 RepID=A0A7S3K4T7_9STRA|mmetsp:Transcript_18813/g.28378  ORF Transcript_18813/g.28378 Transcript_18813/m.28378 type:complete len:258 (+) Transcript_18813:158-931(+)|eukprot:CAMPEP_0197356272 /NCGR_PEP_ID=MMETSP0893-20130614/48636_1 /TAXON_ID=44058 ORGANISM="Aureoumbra lagunensis, Strain CCMP1510" /NCGR_SAMPLE_ID=MMETSP0893 /ASSEMBLY_ACC=CAM_ASM_000539 /LENGTH=257 /DNA_ID=CAMNT_0042873815 /DNA_START=34 /DNA_END=807 /DNA_ORIENTATION=+
MRRCLLCLTIQASTQFTDKIQNSVVGYFWRRSASRIQVEEKVVQIEYEIKRSRFVGTAGIARDWDSASSIISAYSDLKARHNCYAWISKSSGRSSDDGEPSGTAGKPIRDAISSQGCNNVVVLVTRYKPSTAPKLGAGGLIRAYGQAARDAVKKLCEINPDILVDEVDSTYSEQKLISLIVPIAHVGKAQQLIASWERSSSQDYAISRLSEEYDATSISIVLSVSEHAAQSLLDEAQRRLGASSLLRLVDSSDYQDR